MMSGIQFMPQSHSPLHLGPALLDSSDGLVIQEDRFHFHLGKYPWDRKNPDVNPQNCEHQRRVEKRLKSFNAQCQPSHWLKNSYVLGISPFSNNYYHFITEILPACLYNPLRTLLVSNSFPETYIQFLNQLGIGVEKLGHMDGHPPQILRIDDIWVPRCSPLTPEVCRYIFKTVTNKLKCDISDTTLRLYISREFAPQRRILNEAECIPILKNYGLQIHHFEKYSLQQQILISLQTQFCIAPHGAGLANMLFMPQNTKILEIRPTVSSGQFCFENLAKCLGHNYKYILAQHPQGFWLSPRELDQTLMQIFNAK
jgi:capsular polysaccharide biosynthesis protein